MTKQRILGMIIAVLVVIQIPAWFFQTNPPVMAEPKWDSSATRDLAMRACFDCHSNETVWPIYARVAPISWLITFDTISGRRHLNFSEWGASRQGEGTREASRQIESGAMPPALYIALHPAASLTDTEKQQLIQGLQNSLK